MSDPNPTRYGPYSDTHIPLYAKMALWLRDSTGQFTPASGASSPQVFANTGASSLTGLIGGSIVSDGSANAYIANASGVPKKVLKAGDAFTFADNVGAVFGDGSDITILWDATNLVVSQAAADSNILWGVSGAGINHTFYGDTAGRDMQWDQTNDQLLFLDNAKLAIGTGAGAAGDITFSWNGTKMLVGQLTANSAIDFGVSGAGIDLQLYGDTAGRDLLWDQSIDSLIFADSTVLGIGSGAGAGADITFSWDGTRLNVNQLTANSEIRWGVDGAGLDQRWYGDTASAAMVFDQSLDALTFEGAASIRGIRTSSTTAAAITGTTVLTLADSGGVFSVSQASAYDIDLPSPTSGPRLPIQLLPDRSGGEQRDDHGRRWRGHVRRHDHQRRDKCGRGDRQHAHLRLWCCGTRGQHRDHEYLDGSLPRARRDQCSGRHHHRVIG